VKATKNNEGNTSDRELVAVRFLDAPRELVWKVWTEPRHIAHWWGPKGFTNTIHTMDVKPGGVWEFIMHGPDGINYPNKNTFEEVVKPERLVYVHSAPAFRATITFEEQGAKTKLTMRMVFESAELRDQIVKAHKAAEGLEQNMDRLVKHIGHVSATTHKTLGDVFFKREFDAPRQLVFDAWTKRELLEKWWGPKGFTNPRCDIDVRPGGAIRIDMRGPNGIIYPMIGTFKEITPPERIVFVSGAIDERGKPIFDVENIITFEELNGKTVLSVHASVTEVFDEVAYQHMRGMEIGWSQSLDRLQEMVQTLAPTVR
jgi:uncharacterized protein YndB with AHSA1/START domain